MPKFGLDELFICCLWYCAGAETRKRSSHLWNLKGSATLEIIQLLWLCCYFDCICSVQCYIISNATHHLKAHWKSTMRSVARSAWLARTSLPFIRWQIYLYLCLYLCLCCEAQCAVQGSVPEPHCILSGSKCNSWHFNHSPGIFQSAWPADNCLGRGLTVSCCFGNIQDLKIFLKFSIKVIRCSHKVHHYL